MTNRQSKLLTVSTAILIGIGAQSGSLYAADGYQSEDTAKLETSVAKSIALDASSEDSFRLSLKAMRAVLTTDERTKLGLALKKLSADNRSMMSTDSDQGKPLYGSERITKLYETLGSRLNGKTYDDIIAMAGE